MTPRSALSILLLSACGCGQMNALNSVAGDAGKYSLDGSPQFLAARSLMAEKCASCHSGFVSRSEEEWLSAPPVLVQASSPSTSELYLRLKNNGIDETNADMPSGDTLSTQEAAVIRDWINTL